ncbi:hypothetical protein_185 [Stanieria sp. NIES-3757]|nr:hypothetical protein_185 [Stanieria sp. NIES-3757]
MLIAVHGDEEKKMKLNKSKFKAIALCLNYAKIATIVFTTILCAGVRPTLAAEIFDNQGIQFDEDTIIDFQFIQSHGAYQSTFGVINLDTGEKTPLLVEVKSADNEDTIYRESKYQDDFESKQATDFIGTPGNTVPQSLGSFTFLAGNRYVFYLESSFNNQPAGIVYSSTLDNLGQNRQAKFVGGLNELANGGVMLRWDDTGSMLVRENLQDIDFDDFIVGVGGEIKCIYGSEPNSDSDSDSDSAQ